MKSYRLSSRRISPPADGTGLGLAVVQNIIEQHSGTIRAESQPGAGAIFTLWLPVDAQRREDEQR